MEYQIFVTKYELNTLIDVIRNQLSEERGYYQEFLHAGDDFAAELQSKTITELYTLLGKLTAIPQKGDK